MNGLRLQQDAPVLFADFETKVLPAIDEAFGPLYKAHLLNRMEGGIYFSVRNGIPCKTDGFHVRFEFANWGAHYGADASLPHYEDAGPLIPWNHESNWIHNLWFKSCETTKWTAKEKTTMQIALVKVLQWRPLHSQGYKLARAYYIEPRSYDYIGQLPPQKQRHWNRPRLKDYLRHTYIKVPRAVNYPTVYDELRKEGIRKRKATAFVTHVEAVD